jgi:hypothetical protein
MTVIVAERGMTAVVTMQMGGSNQSAIILIYLNKLLTVKK